MSEEATGTRFEGPGDSPGFLLWRATLRWERVMARALAPYGLTHTQFVLLACAWWLTRDGTPMNQARLSAFSGSDARMTSEVLRRLEAAGQVERSPDPADARGRLVTVTPGGRRTAGAAVAAVESADDAFFGAVGPEVSAALRILAGAPDSPG